jgi:hypothetical protein
MTKKSVIQKTRDDSDKPDYEVGYGRPPVHTRVKPGEVLNRGGRPKGQRNVCTVIQEALNERVKMRKGSRTRSVTKLDAFILNVVNGAASGDDKKQARLTSLLERTGKLAAPADTTHQEPFTADDEALIADFLERRSKRGESTAGSDENAETEEGNAGKEKKS